MLTFDSIQDECPAHFTTSGWDLCMLYDFNKPCNEEYCPLWHVERVKKKGRPRLYPKGFYYTEEPDEKIEASSDSK